MKMRKILLPSAAPLCLTLLLLSALLPGCGKGTGGGPAQAPPASAASSPAPLPTDIPAEPSPEAAGSKQIPLMMDVSPESLLAVCWDEENGPRHTVTADSGGFEELRSLLFSLRGTYVAEAEHPVLLRRFYLRLTTGSTWLQVYASDGKVLAQTDYGKVCFSEGSEALTETLCELCREWGGVEGTLIPVKADPPEGEALISLQTEYPVYAPWEPVWVIMENLTEDTVSWNHDPVLEVFRDGAWYRVPWRDGFASLLLLTSLSPGERRGWGAGMLCFDWSMTPGTYRLRVDHALYSDYSNARGRFDRSAFVEFTVAEDNGRLPFAPLAEQSLDPETARAQGCAVVTSGADDAPILEFLEKLSLGIPGELRIVYPEEGMIRHLSCSGPSSLVPEIDELVLETLRDGRTETEYYRSLVYLPEEGMLALSTWSDPEAAFSLGYPVNWEADVLRLCPADGALAEYFSAGSPQISSRDVLQRIVCPPDASTVLELFPERDVPGMSLGLSGRSGGWGRSVRSEPEIEGTPVRLRADWDAAALWVTWRFPDGHTEERKMIPDTETRGVLIDISEPEP